MLKIMFVKHYVDMMYEVSRKLRTPIEVFNRVRIRFCWRF